MKTDMKINPLKAGLNPICHLLALLGTHPILHVSRIRVNFAIFCTMRNMFFWVITQRVVVIPYRRFGTTYNSYLQKPLKMGTLGCSETSVRN